jgi:tRNA pseudouridine38-40 synthase
VPHFKLTLAYDGTSAVGWQRQAEGTAIQQLLEDVLAILEGAPVTVHGAGRTDAGVHAQGQVASVTLTRAIDAPTLTRAMNAHLPETVRVLDAVEMPPAFHARFDAVSKTYRYRIWNAAVLNPFERHYAWHVPEPRLDVRAMAAAAQALEGRHDFAAFQASGSPTRMTVREIFSSTVVRDDELVTYEVSGEGFLRHMVRSIVGTLVEVGRGKRPPAWMHDVIASRSRIEAGRTVPPHGLVLVRVEYAAPEGVRPDL